MAQMTFEATKKPESTDFYKCLFETVSQFQADVGYRGKRTPRVGFATNTSLKDKEELLHLEFLAEITRMTGVDFSNTQIPMEVHAQNPIVKWATYAIVGAGVDMVLPDAIIGSDVLGAFVEPKFGALGDTFNFEKEANDLYLVYKNGNDRMHAEVQRDEKTNITIHPEPHIITVQANLYKVLIGTESLAKFIVKAAYSMESEISEQAYATMTAAFESIATTGDEAMRVVGFTEVDFITLCQKVTAWNNGAEAVVAGTKLALQQVLPDDATVTRIQIDTPYVTQGYMTVFKGVQVIELKQTAKRNSEYLLNLKDDQLYIFSPSSDKLVKLAIAGNTITIVDDVYKNADLSQKASLHKRWGLAIATSAVGASIELT